jgi:hypothetical protein
MRVEPPRALANGAAYLATVTFKYAAGITVASALPRFCISNNDLSGVINLMRTRSCRMHLGL